MKKFLTFFLIALLCQGLSASGSSINTGRRTGVLTGIYLPVSVKQVAPQGVKVVKDTPVEGNLGYAAVSLAESRAVMMGEYYGYASYCPKDGFVKGVDKIEGDKFTRMWQDPINKENVLLHQDYGFYLDGKYCGYILDYFWGTLYGYYWAEVDVETGKKVVLKEIDASKGFMQIFTYNRADGYLYGYGMDADKKLSFLRAPLNNPAATEVITSIQDDGNAYCNALTYNEVDRNIYGINDRFEFVKIGLDGKQTVISKSADATKLNQVLCGFTYCADAKVFYWNASYRNNDSMIYSITPSGEFSKICDTPDKTLYSCFFTPVSTANPDVPAKPELVENKFLNGSTTGSLVYKISDKFEDGKAITGELTYICTVDGENPQNGKGNAGTNATVNFTNLTTGFHSFDFSCTFNGKTSNVLSSRMFIGKDTPIAPQNVALANNKVTWDAVTTGVNGGYVDVENMKYEVYLNSEFVGTTSATTMNVTIPTDISVTAFNARVIAVYGDIKGEAGVSNVVVSGKPLEIPVAYAPTEDQAATMTVIDVNKDGLTWYYDAQNKALYSNYTSSASQPMNDWIFMPAIHFPDANKYYTLTYDWAVKDPYMYKYDYMEVAVCKTIEGTITPVVTIMEKTQAPEVYTTFEKNFKLPEAGDYYIGFHAVCNGDHYGMYLRDITVEDLNILPSSPALPTELKAVAGEKGALNATVSMKLPEKTISGETITATTTITAVINAEEEVTVSGKPGETVSKSVKTAQGFNTIVVYLKDGDKRGEKIETTVFTGIAKPLAVQNFTLTPNADRTKVTMSWQAPEGGENGGYIDPKALTYIVLHYQTTETPFGPYSGWVKIGEVKDGLTYEFTPEEGKQELYNLAVLAQNIAGDGPAVAANILVGKLYDLPISEKIKDNQNPFVTYPWLLYYVDGKPNPNWGFSTLGNINGNLWPDNNEYAFAAVAWNAGAAIQLATPYFSTLSKKNIEVELTLFCGDNAPSMTVLAERPGKELETVYTFVKPTPDANKFGKVKFTLPETYDNQSYARLYIYPQFANPGDLFVLTTISIDGGKSGIDAVEAGDIRIIGETGYITVTGAEGKDVTVYSVDGRMVVSRNNIDNDCSIAASKGLYIVRAGNKVAKVIVK